MTEKSSFRPAAFYVPVNYRPLGLPERLVSCAHYVLNLLHWKWVCWQADEDGFVRLHYDLLTKIIPRADWQTVKYHLLDRAVIDCDLTAVAGSKCFGYRLRPEYRKAKRVECADLRLNRAIRRACGTAERTLAPVHRWLFGHLKRLDFDAAGARPVIAAALPDLESPIGPAEYRDQLTAHAQKLANRESFLHCDRFGRVHTLVSSLAKPLRLFLRVGGTPLVNLDLANSQPLIAGLVARRFYASAEGRGRFLRSAFDGASHTYRYRMAADACGPGPADVEDYLALCAAGRFYESFGTNLPRDEVKRRFYTDVFFGPNKIRSRVKTAFEARFPSVAAMLRSLKVKDYRRAAWVLQNMEASVFIQGVCNRLRRDYPRLPVFTIHDSIMTVPNGEVAVRTAIERAFIALGIHPTVRREKCNA